MREARARRPWAPLLWANGGDLFAGGDRKEVRLVTEEAVRRSVLDAIKAAGL